ncbi:MAG: IS200/IS605 family transposase [Gemmatimonadales bacterium]
MRIGVHLVWATKNRHPWLEPQILRRLAPLLGNIAVRRRCQPLAIGGWVDHVHVYVGLSANIPLSSLVVALKSNSSAWLRESFPDLAEFRWQRGFAAFGVDPRDDEALRRYIRSQEQIHARRLKAPR